MYAVLLWLRLELLRRVGVLSNLFCSTGDLGFSVDYQSNLAKILSFWSTRMAMAESDVLEIAAAEAIVL